MASYQLAHLDLIEACGPTANRSEVAVVEVVLLGQDVHSASSLAKPVKLNASGAPVFTFERWLRMRLAPPIGAISSVSVWVPDLALPDGWDVRYGVAVAYQSPTQAQSRIAVRSLPLEATTGPTLDARLTVDSGGYISTPWIVLQASLAGTSVESTLAPFSLTLGWTES